MSADEIERLRADLDKSNTAYLQLHDLVNAWVDAENGVTITIGPCDGWVRYLEAWEALRKAVGR